MGDNHYSCRDSARARRREGGGGGNRLLFLFFLWGGVRDNHYSYSDVESWQG